MSQFREFRESCILVSEYAYDHHRSEAPPHSCRAKDVRDFLRRQVGSHPLVLPISEDGAGPPRGWRPCPDDIALILGDAGITVSTLPGEDAQAPKNIAVLWRDMVEYCIAVISPTSEVFGSESGRQKQADLGLANWQWWKRLCFMWAPFDPSMCGFEVPAEFAETVADVRMNYKKVCAGVASHTLLVHATEVYRELGFKDGRKFNEEGLDHFFCVLHDTKFFLFFSAHRSLLPKLRHTSS